MAVSRHRHLHHNDFFLRCNYDYCYEKHNTEYRYGENILLFYAYVCTVLIIMDICFDEDVNTIVFRNFIHSTFTVYFR